jgi:tetratricopeptide (TPR) repeat protein
MPNDHPATPFFTVGGTLSLDAVYITRPTDEALLQAVRSGEYCNVLAPRQTGKSSLMVRTAARLRREGVRTAVIDLTDIGTELDAEEWYLGLVTRLREQLGLAVDERAWWEAHIQKGAVQRFSDFLRDVVLEEFAEPVVVFVDEIDSTLSLPFTDDFFAAIRAAYNARASDPAYKRLTFVLLGVARPADLIKDRSRTPYNIGFSIDLKDFSLEEAKELLPGLEIECVSPSQAEMILKRVLYWTGGHPYLTQKVCAEIVASEDGTWTEERIDGLVKRVFLSDEARKESNLQYVGDRVRESPDREKLLRTYRKVLAGKPIDDEERDPVKSQLKLAGLIKATSQGTLAVRNRIYEAVFDRQWVQVTMPKLTSTRIAALASAAAVIALALTGWLLYRGQNSDEIRAQTYTETFLDAQSPAVRVTNLAGLFELGGEFAASGRDLFFGLDADEQVAMFTALNAPEQVGDDLQTVIRGIYTHLELAPEGNDPQNDLLHAMANDLEQIEDDFPDSRILRCEINAWLQGRERFQNGEHEAAIDAYTQATSFNSDAQNPATHLDRALAYARAGQYDNALADLSHVLELDPDRRTQVADRIQLDPALRDYLANHGDDFPTLATSVE